MSNDQNLSLKNPETTPSVKRKPGRQKSTARGKKSKLDATEQSKANSYSNLLQEYDKKGRPIKRQQEPELKGKKRQTKQQIKEDE